MKRPMLLAAVISAAAVIINVRFLQSTMILTGCLISTTLLFIFKRNRYPVRFWWILTIFPIITCITQNSLDNLTYYADEAAVYDSSVYDSSVYNSSEFELTALVLDVTDKGDYKNVCVKTSLLKEAVCIVTVNSDYGFIITPGDRIKINGTLELFDKPTNPGQFDLRKYYISRGICYRIKPSDISLIKKGNGLRSNAYKLREKIEAVYEQIYDEKTFGIMNSVVLGDKSVLDADVKSMYQKNGIAHLLAISGLHISIVGVVLYRLLKRNCSYIVSGLISMIVMLSYLCLTGNGVSARRAVIMLLVIILADIFGRTSDSANTFGLAMLITISLNPLCLWDTGFLMSYTAYAGIIFVYPIFSDKERFLIIFEKLPDKKYNLGLLLAIRFIDSVCLSISIMLSTLPVVLLLSYEIPIHSVLLNIFVIPLMSLVMVSGIFVAIFGIFPVTGFEALVKSIAVFMAGAGTYITRFYEKLCVFSEHLGIKTVLTGAPTFANILLYVVILSTMAGIVFWGLHDYLIEVKMFRLISVIWLFMLIFSINGLHYRTGSKATLTMLDVGQGDCFVYRTKYDENVLFDSGSLSKNEIGKYILTDYLKYTGSRKLDYVLVSHADTDHISGINEIIDEGEIEISCLILPDISNKDENYLELERKALNNGINVKYAKLSDEIKLKDTSIKCLHPCNSFKDNKSLDANDCSAVYLIEYEDWGILMMGDASKESEECIINDLQESGILTLLSNVDILKVGHHGSKTSTSDKLLSIISPKAAFISCGKNNIYGHPHTSTIQKLETSGIKVFRTDKSGAVIFPLTK